MSGRRTLRSAFTLLEILLVIAILVILAGSAAVMLMKSFDKAKVDTAKTWTSANGPIAQCLDLYKKDNNTYPDTQGGLNALLTPPDGTPDEKKTTWPYLQGGTKGLLDPWGNAYQYACPGSHNTDGFDLWSKGADGKDEDGSRDGICNWETTTGSGGVVGKGP